MSNIEERLSKLEDAVFGKDKEPVEPKFKAGEAYKNPRTMSIVICTENGETLYGYGISSFGEWNNIYWNRYQFTEKATPEETQAMLRKACEIKYGKDWENVKIKEHADNPGKNINDGKFCVIISQYMIWNKNGCIMYKGKWAEKLEEKFIISDSYGFHVCLYDEQVSVYRDNYGNVWNNSQASLLIEPYSPERLIQLAEKF